MSESPPNDDVVTRAELTTDRLFNDSFVICLVYISYIVVIFMLFDSIFKRPGLRYAPVVPPELC